MSRRILALAALFAALAASACSGGSTDDPTPTLTQPAATATVEAPPTPDPVGAPEASGEQALEHVRKLSVDFGPRVAGTDREIEARDYLSGVLESYGYDVEIQEFSFDGTRYRPARVDAGADAYAAVAFEGSPVGSVTALVVDAGIGRPEEFPTSGLGGAIALIERGDLQFTQKIDNAAAAGAGAVIIFNTEDGPLVGNAPDAQIPAVGITRADGQALREQLAAGQVEATVRVIPPTGTAYNVIARPPGVSDCATVTGGHADSVAISPGADDNASGSAGVLEVARLAMASRLPGANCFVLFGAEEFGLWGSKYFVASLTDAEADAMRGMLNLDVIGLPVDLTLIGSEDLVEVARGHAQELGVDATPGTVPSGSSSDHASFDEAGIPVVFFYRHDAGIHQTTDAVDRIDADALEDTIRVAYATLVELAGSG